MVSSFAGTLGRHSAVSSRRETRPPPTGGTLRPQGQPTGSVPPAYHFRLRRPVHFKSFLGHYYVFPKSSPWLDGLSCTSPFSYEALKMRRHTWRILPFALNTGGPRNTGGREGLNGDDEGLGRTRVGTIVSAAARQLLGKLNGARKNFPVKVFLLLLGFYTANALATILGQTGDWDVLVAGVVVAAIEGIGMLMYRKPFVLRIGRLQSLVVMVNYWKAGVCLGLFVDAFKLGS